MSAPPYGSESTWSWPEEVVTDDLHDQASAESSFSQPDFPHAKQPSETKPAPQSHEGEASSNAPPKPEKHYGSRTCRICLEVVQPTFETGPEGLAGVVAPTPTVKYVSEDPTSGRLIRPCKCKGSQSYVHEACLQGWRHADPSYGRRNYFECPTCKYTYRLERMRWSKWIGSTMAQIVLTLLILWATVFLLGFVAEPIIKLYLDPVATLTTNPWTTLREPLFVLEDDEELTWFAHILKGFASLGLLGFVSPFEWINVRWAVGGAGRARRGRTGRDRLEDISLTMIMIGVATFLYATWKGVRAWSRHTLEKAGERVVDVHGEEDDDEEPDATPSDDAEAAGTEADLDDKKTL
ncbi:hypothetical protein V494_08180 [Pseudogymnoascus sp. VKM F-4513 (FW-928)]|nr:hypothetical protein V494_08180 [Pseudogymnoascus sp. VKM F-4513 (FW-928)]